MKKSIIIFILLYYVLMAACGQEQTKIRFYGGIDYYPQNSTKIREDRQIGDKLYDILLSCRGGDYALRIGAEHNPYDEIYVYSSIRTEMNAIKIDKWNPVRVDYTIGVKYKWKILEFGIEHECYHPISVYEYKETEARIYGGYTKFSISFSTK